MRDRVSRVLMRRASTPVAGTPPAFSGAHYKVDAEILTDGASHGLAFATTNHRKVEFLAVLAHELRNPLASIHYAACLLDGSAGETLLARQRTQTLIERQVQRMTQLVDDLLDVSRVALGRLRLQRERIDLRLVVGRAIETLEPAIREHHHRLTAALPDAPVWLQGDPGRLEQVFVNLLANAAKYTHTGGELAVRMHSHDGQAIVRVRDSGIGIVAEALPHIFDLFNQAEATGARTGGLGIGLALVRDLVESHGGTVTAESAGLGQGSEFTVCLPAA
ncbi:MAG: HAMP domain-containing sensor histidine kinase [Steroidobacteraceae bacterium]